MRTFRHRVAPIALLTAALMLAASCSSSSKPSSDTTPGGSSDKVTLRLGYLPNVTHAPAIIGLQNKTFANDLGSNVTLKTSTYNSGTDETTALLAGALDAAFVGPNPAINAYQKSGGTLIRIVSGVASGGAFLVVKPSITSAADLKGKKLATPSLGNTQDVALRTWLATKGYKTTTEGGGDVTIVPQDNSVTLTAFQSGAIDGAWVPEPYATQLQQEGGKVLVDEATLWPKGQFVTTNLVVATKYLSAHADLISNLLKGLDSSINLIKTDPAEGRTTRVGRHRGGQGQGAGDVAGRDLVQEHHVHARPDCVVAQDRRRAREGFGIHRLDRSEEHLRPHAAQQDVDGTNTRRRSHRETSL